MSVDDRLAAIRGAQPARPHTARTIAALTANPGCTRRAVLDAAGVDKPRLAARAGFPMPSAQSPFAITRGNAFEAQVKANGGAELLRLLREQIGLPVPEVAYTDLDPAGGETALPARHERTRQLLTGAAAGTLFDHPLLTLEVAGRTAYLEPDLVAMRLAGRFHVVEIKSFPIIDGRADGAKVAAAVTQAAVYVLALREMLAGAGDGPESVADEIVLVCPENFANRPTAVRVDVRKQLTVLRRQLDRLDRIEDLLATVPAGFTLDTDTEPAAALRVLPSRYAPDCLDTCELAHLCRSESRDDTAALGRSVRDELGGIASVTAVLDLAEGRRTPEPDQVEAADVLATAERLRRAVLAGTA